MSTFRCSCECETPPAQPADWFAGGAGGALDEGSPRARGEYRHRFPPGLADELGRSARAGDVFHALDARPAAAAATPRGNGLLVFGLLAAFAYSLRRR